MEDQYNANVIAERLKISDKLNSFWRPKSCCYERRAYESKKTIQLKTQIFNILVASGPIVDDTGWNDGFEYVNTDAAIRAFLDWDGTGDAPDGWIRQIGTGRRRPGGDKEKEEVRA